MKRRVTIKQELKRHVIGKKDIPSVKTSVYKDEEKKKRTKEQPMLWLSSTTVHAVDDNLKKNSQCSRR
jgi:hypothetical protein